VLLLELIALLGRSHRCLDYFVLCAAPGRQTIVDIAIGLCAIP